MCGEWEVGDELDAHAAAMEGFETVDGGEDVGVDCGCGAVDDFFDEDFVDEFAGFWGGLAAAAELVGCVGDGFEAPAVAFEGVAERGDVEGDGLEAAFEHEGAGHAGVVFEVAVEEPVGGGQW